MIRPLYERFVELGNAGASELGFSDLGEQWRAGYDMEPDAVAAEIDRLWDQVRPLYEKLHCHVRARLAEYYGEDVVGAVASKAPGQFVKLGFVCDGEKQAARARIGARTPAIGNLGSGSMLPTMRFRGNPLAVPHALQGTGSLRERDAVVGDAGLSVQIGCNCEQGEDGGGGHEHTQPPWS